MAKIIAKASLVQNSNLFLHIADKGATDITLAEDVAFPDFTLTTVGATVWDDTAAADVDGVINRGIVVGDEVTLSHMGTVANEGIIATVTGVTTTVLSCTMTSGHTIVAEASGSAMNIVATKKTYQFVEAGDMSFVDGCQGIVLASKLVDMWDTLDLDKYLKPFNSIEPRAKSLASLNGWEPHDTSTIDGIRDTALEVRSDATTARQIYALWRSGDLNAGTDQFNFWPSSDADATAPTSAVMTGYMNQLFLIYDADGADNRKSNGVTWFTRCAEPFKTIVMEEHDVDYAEIMPVASSNTADPKLTVDDASGAPYSNVTFQNDILDYSGDVDGTPYDFDYLLDANTETNQTVHNRINYLLRQSADMNGLGDGGSMRGDKQWPITTFSGEVFTVIGYLLDYDVNTRNDLRVTDVTPTVLSWPATMGIAVTSGSLGIGGAFTIWHKNSYGTDAAVVFQNESDVNQQDIVVAASVQIVMAFSTYAVDGHTPGDDLAVVISINRPGFVEPETVEAIFDGNNISVPLPNIPDPSYIA